MRNDFQKEVSEIVATAIEKSPETQKEYIDEACRDKPEIRQEVEELLAADSQASVLDSESVFTFAGLPNLERKEVKPKSFSDSLIGETLENRYLITEKIGEGGMGYVFKAEDKKLTNRSVVVKLLKPEVINQEYLLTKFQHEMEALARVKGEGVIDIYDIGTLNKVPYIVTEYFDGTSLDKIIQPAGLPFADVAEIMKKIGRALFEVHKTGIIHRDLKPSNIMVKYTPDEIKVKIIDFGIARVKDSLVSSIATQTGRMIGTIYYVSPEQFLGTENLTSATDIFSLGIISYEMLTGVRPFSPTNILQLCEMHRQGVVVLPQALRPDISIEAQSVILKALSYEPHKRFQNAAEFGNELAKSLSQSPQIPASVLGKKALNTNPAESNQIFDNRGVAENSNNQNTNQAKKTSKYKAATFWGLGILGFLSLAIASVIVVSIFVWSRFRGNIPQIEQPTVANTNETPPSVNELRTFKYSLLVQPTEKNREPFIASPMQTFLNGWRFRMQFNSSKSGHLYLLNENLGKDGNLSLTILFPDPRLNSGKAEIESNQTFTTNQYEFSNKPGIEKFWIIWSLKPVTELEAVKNLVNPQDLGMIRNNIKSAAVNDFIISYKDKKTIVKESADKQSVTVEGESEVIVTSAELRHN
jgi:serine/threonine protein kinase